VGNTGESGQHVLFVGRYASWRGRGTQSTQRLCEWIAQSGRDFRADATGATATAWTRRGMRTRGNDRACRSTADAVIRIGSTRREHSLATRSSRRRRPDPTPASLESSRAAPVGKRNLTGVRAPANGADGIRDGVAGHSPAGRGGAGDDGGDSSRGDGKGSHDYWFCVRSKMARRIAPGLLLVYRWNLDSH
jgi:hypothetical protein